MNLYLSKKNIPKIPTVLGRPQKPFREKTNRAKRLRVEEIRKQFPKEEILYSCKVNARSSEENNELKKAFIDLQS